MHCKRYELPFSDATITWHSRKGGNLKRTLFPLVFRLYEDNDIHFEHDVRQFSSWKTTLFLRGTRPVFPRHHWV